jgi:hypothetical protein
MLVAIAGGWLALHLTGSLNWLFAALALGLVLHGLTLVVAISTGAWFRNPPMRLTSGGLIERAALRRFAPARGLSSAKGYEERGEARQQSSTPDPRGVP